MIVDEVHGYLAQRTKQNPTLRGDWVVVARQDARHVRVASRERQREKESGACMPSEMPPSSRGKHQQISGKRLAVSTGGYPVTRGVIGRFCWPKMNSGRIASGWGHVRPGLELDQIVRTMVRLGSDGAD